MDRRGFLRFLGLGAAAAVAAPIIKPKAFFSFYTPTVWKPPTTDLYASTNGSIWLEVWRSSKMVWEKVESQPVPSGSGNGIVVFKQIPTDARYVRYHIETGGICPGAVTAFIDGPSFT